MRLACLGSCSCTSKPSALLTPNPLIHPRAAIAKPKAALHTVQRAPMHLTRSGKGLDAWKSACIAVCAAVAHQYHTSTATPLWSSAARVSGALACPRQRTLARTPCACEPPILALRADRGTALATHAHAVPRALAGTHALCRVRLQSSTCAVLCALADTDQVGVGAPTSCTCISVAVAAWYEEAGGAAHLSPATYSGLIRSGCVCSVLQLPPSSQHMLIIGSKHASMPGCAPSYAHGVQSACCCCSLSTEPPKHVYPAAGSPFSLA